MLMKNDDFLDNKNSFSEEKWNRMIDLWVDEELDNPIKDVITYDNEINNGGHLQFFENYYDNLDEMIKSLKVSLPDDMYNNLKQAYDTYIAKDIDIENIDDYVDVALQEIFDEYDNFYYENDNKIKTILEKYASTIKID